METTLPDARTPHPSCGRNAENAIITTKRQAAANRQNAMRSTGPRTPQGKQAAKWNALRHGLRPETLVLPDEDPEEFERFRNR